VGRPFEFRPEIGMGVQLKNRKSRFRMFSGQPLGLGENGG
jgi:hypothetical protein